MDRWTSVVVAIAVMLIGYLFFGRTKRLPVAVICPRCGSLLPPVRIGGSLSETLWGGWTCENCRRIQRSAEAA
jgi:hypothetical protein